MAAAASNWQQASATRGLVTCLPSTDPAALPPAETDQERGEDDRERVDRRAEEQADLTRPDHFAGQRGETRQGNGE